MVYCQFPYFMYDMRMLSQTNIFGYSGARVQGSRPGSDNVTPSAAKMMPSQNTALSPIQPVSIVNHAGITNENNFYGSRANKQQAPSAVSAEAYLTSRISLRPVYIHNEMITRMQNVSNLSKNPPRFKDQVDLIA